MPGLSSERSDLIVAGVSVVKCLFDKLRASHLIISGCGVREGLFFQHYLTQDDLPEVIADILGHSTLNMLRFYKVSEDHAIFVKDLALHMFDAWMPLHQLDSRDRDLLECAALLHDIGISINYYDHSRHSAYLVENARLFGLTHREQILAAVVAGWHSGISAKLQRNKLYSEFLDEADWMKARKMATLLMIADSLDATQRQFIQRPVASLSHGTAVLAFNAAGDCSIELQSVEKFAKIIQRELGAKLQLELKE